MTRRPGVSRNKRRAGELFGICRPAWIDVFRAASVTFRPAICELVKRHAYSDPDQFFKNMQLLSNFMLHKDTTRKAHIHVLRLCLKIHYSSLLHPASPPPPPHTHYLEVATSRVIPQITFYIPERSALQISITIYYLNHNKTCRTIRRSNYHDI